MPPVVLGYRLTFRFGRGTVWAIVFQELLHVLPFEFTNVLPYCLVIS
jgi:ABC-type molybdate transport system permease subunit